MNRSRKWTDAECRAELDYLATIDRDAPGEVFLHNPKCFDRYRVMQLEHIYRSQPNLIAD